MIAALETLRAQKIGDLIGAARQRLKRKFCFAMAARIDDPQRGAILAFGIARELRVEPVQRPVERHGIGPAKSFHRGIVVGAMLEQKSAGFLERGHWFFPARPRTCWMIPEKSTAPFPLLSNAW